MSPRSLGRSRPSIAVAGRLQAPRHRDADVTLTVSFRHADQLPAASFARTAIVQVPVANENTFVRPVTSCRERTTDVTPCGA